jgi:hypothetical protein
MPLAPSRGPLSFSAYLVAPAFSLSAAFACGCVDCDLLIFPLLELLL